MTKESIQRSIDRLSSTSLFKVAFSPFRSLTGLRLPQAAFRDLVPGRSVHASRGVVTGTRAACGKRMLCLVHFIVHASGLMYTRIACFKVVSITTIIDGPAIISSED